MLTYVRSFAGGDSVPRMLRSEGELWRELTFISSSHWTLDCFYNQPLVRATRAASMRLPAPSLLIASER